MDAGSSARPPATARTTSSTRTATCSTCCPASMRRPRFAASSKAASRSPRACAASPTTNVRSGSSTTTEQRVIAARRDWERLAGTARISAMGQLLTQARIESQLAAAQRATMAKAVIEVKDLRVVRDGTRAGSLVGGSDRDVVRRGSGAVRHRRPERPRARVLDDTSRALIVRLHNACRARCARLANNSTQ